MTMTNKTNKRILASKTQGATQKIAMTAAVTFVQEPATQTADGAGAGGEARPVKSFEMVAYTGGAMRLMFWRYPVVIDLAGLTAGNSKRPIYLQHEYTMAALLGQTTEVTKTQDQLSVKGRFLARQPAAKQVMDLQEDGYEWQASVGVSPSRVEFVDAGKSVVVNGRSFNGPLYVTRAGTLDEVSFVMLGADDNTSAKIAAGRKTSVAAKGNAMTFEQWLADRGLVASGLSLKQRESLEKDYNALVAAGVIAAAGGGGGDPADPVDPGTAEQVIADLRARRAAEIGRQNAITKACGGKHGDIEAKAIAEGWSVDKTELEVMRAERPQPGSLPAGGGGNRGGGLSKMAAAVAFAAICASAGMQEEAIAKSLPDGERQAVMNEAMSGKMRGFGIQSLMDWTIRAAGESFDGQRTSSEFLVAALKADQKIQASGTNGFTTLSLSGILSNLAKKVLLETYTAQNVVWDQIAGLGNNSDFKPTTRYRLDSSGGYQQVSATGELKHSGLSEAGYSSAIDTFGTLISLTRKMMINDDLGAFLQVPGLLGRMAAVRLEEAVFSLWMSNPSNFFSTGNRNLLTGAGSVLSISALTDAETLLGNQVDSNGKPILMMADRILVGTNNKVLAEQLYKESDIRNNTANKEYVVKNPHSNKFRVIVSPYINNAAIKDSAGAAIANQSQTKFWLLGNPAVRAAIRVSLLNGNRTPVLESAETDFATLGMQWRSYHDFGVGMEDAVAAVQSNGA
jgi:hypothetical protein